jgi:uncharacterized protein
VRIVIAGGSGFLGHALTRRLAADGHELVVLTRRPETYKGPARAVAWQPNGEASGPWTREIDGAGAIVNLAGEGIADKRWSESRKKALSDSRIRSTGSLVTAVRGAGKRPGVLIQASAEGYYDVGSEEILDESSKPGSNFLSQLCVAWEGEATRAADLGVRVVFVRTCIVLAREGGALKKLLPPFLLFGGGPIASGRQYYSWIHLDDWVEMVVWAMSNPAVSGPINAGAPSPVRNVDFSRALGRALHRPSWLPVPAFALRILVGEMADPALISGHRVVPKRPLELGFRFKYPEIEGAMRAAVRQRGNEPKPRSRC